MTSIIVLSPFERLLKFLHLLRIYWDIKGFIYFRILNRINPKKWPVYIIKGEYVKAPTFTFTKDFKATWINKIKRKSFFS